MDSKSKEFLRTIEEHKEMYTAEELERIRTIFSSNKPFFAKYAEYTGIKTELYL